MSSELAFANDEAVDVKDEAEVPVLSVFIDDDPLTDDGDPVEVLFNDEAEVVAAMGPETLLDCGVGSGRHTVIA